METTSEKSLLTKRSKVALIVTALLGVSAVTGYLLLRDSKVEATGSAVKVVSSQEKTFSAPSTVNTANTVNPANTANTANTGSTVKTVNSANTNGPSEPSSNAAATGFVLPKAIVVSEAAKEFVDELLQTDQKLKDKVDSGDFLRAKKRIADKSKHWRSDENLVRFYEEMVEEIYRRAFTNCIERSGEEEKVKIFADEVIRRDEELRAAVFAGEYDEIKEKFRKKFLRLNSLIKNHFASHRAAIAEELYQRALINKPRDDDEDDDSKVDFAQLADESIVRDEILRNFVRNGKFENVKKHFMTKTLKLYGANSEMNIYRGPVVDVLIQRAEDNFFQKSLMAAIRRDEVEFSESAMDADEELRELVESGASQYVTNHFLNQTLNLEGLDPNVRANKGMVLEALLRKANLARITNRRVSGDHEAVDHLNEETRKPKKGKRVAFALERNEEFEFD